MFGPESIGKHITQPVANWVFPSETEYIAGGLLRKSIYPGTATPTQLANVCHRSLEASPVGV